MFSRKPAEVGHARHVTHMVASHVTHINESCHTYEWVMSHIWMIHVTHMNRSCHTYEWVVSNERVMSHIWMSHVTRMNESCHTYEWVMLHIWIESCHTHECVPEVSSHIQMNPNSCYELNTPRTRHVHVYPKLDAWRAAVSFAEASSDMKMSHEFVSRTEHSHELDTWMCTCNWTHGTCVRRALLPVRRSLCRPLSPTAHPSRK